MQNLQLGLKKNDDSLLIFNTNILIINPTGCLFFHHFTVCHLTFHDSQTSPNLTHTELWWFNPCLVSRGLRLANKHLYIMSHTLMAALSRFMSDGGFFFFVGLFRMMADSICNEAPHKCHFFGVLGIKKSHNIANKKVKWSRDDV